jgi:TetR/AcrR family transcriptional regulator
VSERDAPPPRGARTPRRHRDETQRRDTALRTRARILDAAAVEFGAKGYSGARTAAIAARAQVNQQLIAYYFGGKQGLLDELRARWQARQQAMPSDGCTFAESLARHLDATLDQADWARLVVWQALGDGADPGTAEAVRAQADRTREGVDRLRARQQAGEVTGDVSAEFVLLLAHLIAFAPISLGPQVRSILGVEPGSAEYRRTCLDQLMTLLRPDR